MESQGLTMTLRDDKPTREQLDASNPERSIWVSANAGAGKTKVLVDRVIRLMLSGAEPDTILCLTFTKAAAAEMKARLFGLLGKWTLADDDTLQKQLTNLDISTSGDMLVKARQLFTKALETPGGLKIQTIHAFAEKLLQLFPVEAGLAPGFKVLDERATEDLITLARNTVLSTADRLGDADSEFVGRAIEIVNQFAGEQRFDELLKAVFSEGETIHALLGEHRSYADVHTLVLRTLELDGGDSAESLAIRLTHVDEVRYRSAATALAGVKAKMDENTVAGLQDMLHATTVDDRMEALRETFFNQDMKPRARLLVKETTTRHQATADWLHEEFARVVQLMTQHDLHIRADATASLLFLADRISTTFENAKRALSAYDFSDLIARASQLLNSRIMTEWVLYKLDRGITHILVDEAQDTSPEQWSIIRAIANEFFAGEGAENKVKRTLFVVGDQKQSIFSFQGADARVFQSTRDDVSAQVLGVAPDSPQISMLTSYRSVPEVLDFVDAVLPGTASAAMGLNPDDDSQRKHYSNRAREHGLVQLWPLIESEEPKEPDHWLVPVDRPKTGFHRRLLARKVATTVQNWIGKRNIPSLGPNRIVQAGDILILLRSRGPLFTMIIAELRALGIRVAGADRIKLLDNLAVQDLLAFAQTMTLPEDDYSLACVLKSPLVPQPLDEADLFQLSYDRNSAPLRTRLLASQNPKAIANAQFLESMRNLARSEGPFAFFSRILSFRRKDMQSRLGPEARDATDAFLDFAIDYEHEQGTSLAGFAAWFQASETTLKREMEKAGNQVRLMTVHGAKGLESEIVIIPDAADAIPNERVNLVQAQNGLPIWAISDLAPSSLIDELKETRKRLSLEEHVRLLYVAMTRARDELYIAGSLPKLVNKDGNKSLSKTSWYHFIEGQLAIQSDIAMRKIDDPFYGGEVLHHGATSAHFEDQGRPDHKVSAPRALPQWLREAAPLPAHARPVSVTRLTGQNVVAPDAAERLSFGLRVHEFFRMMPSRESGLRTTHVDDAVHRFALDLEFLARLVESIEAPDLAPYFATGSMTEVDILASLPSGEDMSGRIDRLRITDRDIFLLDYKTDAHPPQDLSPDMPAVQQISLYSQSVSEAYPGRTAHVAIFWTAEMRLDVLDPALTTQACDRAQATNPAGTP
jgi:ATP-dependent helicase/nuclease subunit A